MESRVEDIVIVGAGVAGLATSLGLHRLGVRSLVLESSNALRTGGFCIALWTNAWKALDALGIGDILRGQHLRLRGNVTTSLITGQKTSSTDLEGVMGKHGGHEIRCVLRHLLLEALAKELPSGTIRFSSKMVAIEGSNFTKAVHLADGTVIRTKILIGCDGVNSEVAKWLDLSKAIISDRSSLRGCITSKGNHNLEPKFIQYLGKGCRYGIIPCDDKTVYWFFTWSPNEEEKKLEQNPTKMKEILFERLENMPSEHKTFLENADLDHFKSYPSRYRHPSKLVFGNISKGNVCVAGDAFHPMTPDLAQGGSCALEDAIVLSRLLGEVFSTKSGGEIMNNRREEEEQYERIEVSLKKYANVRRWRIIKIVFGAYLTGIILLSESKLLCFSRDKFLGAFLARFQSKVAEFDCGRLSSSKME